MSSGEAAGRDAFDFLSNISFGAHDGPSRSSKKPKGTQSRAISSSKSAGLSKSSKSTSIEMVEMKTKNSRSATITTDDSPSKAPSLSVQRNSEPAITPVKLKASQSTKLRDRETKEAKCVA
jgi:hypothetical protein